MVEWLEIFFFFVRMPFQLHAVLGPDCLFLRLCRVGSAQLTILASRFFGASARSPEFRRVSTIVSALPAISQGYPP